LGEISCAISTMPYIINNTPASHRGRMSSMLPIIFGAGQSIGPFVMGMVTESVGISKSWNIILVILLVSTFSMYLLNRYNDKKDKNKKLAIAKS
jgi:MFS family permease